MASNIGPEDPRQTADEHLRRVSAGADQVDIPADGPDPRLAPEEADRPVEAEPGRGGRSRVLAVTVGLVALAAFAGIVWYAYTWGIGGPGGEVPVIKAQSEPEKVRPEDPGGMEVLHQDKLVMNEVSPDPDKPQVERLLPPPETPQPPEPAVEEAAAAGSAEPPENGSDGATTADESAAASAQADGGDSAEIAATAAPDSMEPEMPAPPEANGTAAGTSADGDAAETATADVETAAAEGGTSTATQPSQTAGTNGPAGADGVPSVAQLAQADGGYVIQLASLQSRESAKSEWARLQKVHPGLLGDAKLTIQRAEIEDKGTFYRVQTGPFPNRATAEDMCAILEEANQACLVVRR